MFLHNYEQADGNVTFDDYKKEKWDPKRIEYVFAYIYIMSSFEQEQKMFLSFLQCIHCLCI